MADYIDLTSLILDARSLALLACFPFLCFLVGDLAFYDRRSRSEIAGVSLRLLLGMAVWYFLSSCAGLFGWFGIGSLAATCLAIVAIYALVASRSTFAAELDDRSPNSFSNITRWDWAVFLVLLSYLPLGLSSPNKWDEMMYHLPHARAWFEQGQIYTNTSSRYPLFPLSPSALTAWWLSAGTMLMGKWAGILCFSSIALLIYSIIKRHVNAPAALVAVLFWGESIDGQILGSAYVDIPLASMITGSLVFAFSFFNARRLRSLVFSGFLAGTALSMKYQAVIFLALPCFVCFFWSGSFKRSIAFVIAFCIPCVGWYLRAYLVSGDPVHPFGADWFGYWLWNESDMRAQFNDLSKVRELPPLIVFIGLAAAFFWSKFDQRWRAAVVLAWVWFLGWAMVSLYPRYLTPAFPLLIVLAAIFFKYVASTAFGYSLIRGAVHDRCLSRQWVNIKHFYYAALVVIIILAGVNAASSSKWVFTNSEALSIAYSERYRGFDLLSKHKLNIDPDNRRIFKVLFGGEALLLSSSAIGDHFGPHRIKDLALVSAKPEALAAYLTEHKVAYILMPTIPEWTTGLSNKLASTSVVCLFAESEHAKLFAVRAVDEQNLCAEVSL